MGILGITLIGSAEAPFRRWWKINQIKGLKRQETALEQAFRFELFVEIGHFGSQPGEVLLAAKVVSADHAGDGAEGFLERIKAAGGFILGFAAARAGDRDESDGHGRVFFFQC